MWGDGPPQAGWSTHIVCEVQYHIKHTADGVSVNGGQLNRGRIEASNVHWPPDQLRRPNDTLIVCKCGQYFFRKHIVCKCGSWKHYTSTHLLVVHILISAQLSQWHTYCLQMWTIIYSILYWYSDQLSHILPLLLEHWLDRCVSAARTDRQWNISTIASGWLEATPQMLQMGRQNFGLGHPCGQNFPLTCMFT